MTRGKKRGAEPIIDVSPKRPTIEKEAEDTESDLEKKKEELKYCHYGFKLILGQVFSVLEGKQNAMAAGLMGL